MNTRTGRTFTGSLQACSYRRKRQTRLVISDHEDEHENTEGAEATGKVTMAQMLQESRARLVGSTSTL